MNEITIAGLAGAGVFGAAVALSAYISADAGGREFVARPTRPLILSTRSAEEGAPAYDAYCARCHGRAGEGGSNGPPLVHRFYDIGDKTDAMYLAAIRDGASENRWGFGPMPPVRGVTARQAAAIVGFVAELQAHNAR